MSNEKDNISEGKPHWVRAIKNTAGELEQETKTRKTNLIEFFLIMTIILTTLWLMAYPAVIFGIDWLNTLAIIILVVGGIILLLSPFIHKDEFYGWGLGQPINLFKYLKESDKPQKIIIISIIISIIVVGLTIAGFIFWVYVADFIGINEPEASQIKSDSGGAILIIVGLIIISFIFATVLIRYDNFFSALITAFKIIIPLTILMIVCALLLNGPEAFSNFNLASLGLNFFGYIFWGFIQQLLFSSYFGTRVRKGFGPAKNPEHQKKKRFWVAFLNGAFFGLLHIPSWLLLGVTWLLGVFLSYYFMEDKNRNLLALGMVHGFMGSMLGWLFSSGGDVDIEMSVGPWSLESFDISVFIVVGILVALFIAAMIYVYRNWED